MGLKSLEELKREYTAEFFRLQTLEEINREFSPAARPQPRPVAAEAPARAGRQSRFAKIWQSPITGAAFYILTGLAVLIAFFSNGAGNNGAPRNFFGYSGMIVLTGSMEPELPRGSFVLTKSADPDTLEIGDDITYLYTGDTTITHRIIGIYENYYEGRRGFQTQGINNGLPDEETVIAGNIVGRVIFSSKPLGLFFTFTQNNLILSVLLVALPVILLFSLRMVFSPKYKIPKRRSML